MEPQLVPVSYNKVCSYGGLIATPDPAGSNIGKGSFRNGGRLWSLEGENWTSSTVFGHRPRAVTGHTLFHVGGKVHLHGGIEHYLSGPTLGDSSVWCLDSTMCWSSYLAVGPAPAPRAHHKVAVNQDAGILYVAGGLTPQGNPVDPPNRLHCFSVTSRCWQTVSTSGPAPTARGLRALFFNHNRLYALEAVTGGMVANGSGTTRQVLLLLQLDMESMYWQRVATNGPQPLAASGAAIVADAHHVYIHGGQIGDQVLSSVQRLDLSAMTWSSLALTRGSMPALRNHAGCTFGPGLLFYGGSSGSQCEAASKHMVLLHPALQAPDGCHAACPLAALLMHCRAQLAATAQRLDRRFVTLLAEDTEHVQVPAGLLALHSSLFDDLFSSCVDGEEGDRTFVPVAGHAPWALHMLRDWMQGRMDPAALEPAEAAELYRVADHLAMEELRRECLDRLLEAPQCLAKAAALLALPGHTADNIHSASKDCVMWLARRASADAAQGRLQGALEAMRVASQQGCGPLAAYCKRLLRRAWALDPLAALEWLLRFGVPDQPGEASTKAVGLQALSEALNQACWAPANATLQPTLPEACRACSGSSGSTKGVPGLSGEQASSVQGAAAEQLPATAWPSQGLPAPGSPRPVSAAPSTPGQGIQAFRRMSASGVEHVGDSSGAWSQQSLTRNLQRASAPLSQRTADVLAPRDQLQCAAEPAAPAAAPPPETPLGASAQPSRGIRSLSMARPASASQRSSEQWTDGSADAPPHRRLLHCQSSCSTLDTTATARAPPTPLPPAACTAHVQGADTGPPPLSFAAVVGKVRGCMEMEAWTRLGSASPGQLLQRLLQMRRKYPGSHPGAEHLVQLCRELAGQVAASSTPGALPQLVDMLERGGAGGAGTDVLPRPRHRGLGAKGCDAGASSFAHQLSGNGRVPPASIAVTAGNLCRDGQLGLL